MAAGRWKLYDTAKQKLLQGLLDHDGHTFKCALFLSTSNCDTATHDELADLTNQHANGNGYTTGGATITNLVITQASGTTTWDFDNIAWTATGGSIIARFAVIYDDTVAGDPLIARCLLDTTPADATATDGNPFTISISSSGVFNISGATSN